MIRSLRSGWTAVMLLVPFALLGCSDDSSPTGPQTGEVEVSVRSTSFNPGEITVTTGSTVVFVNQQQVFHVLRSTANSLFDPQQLVNQGDTFEYTFEEAGVFYIFCEVHQADDMIIKITVVDV